MKTSAEETAATKPVSGNAGTADTEPRRLNERIRWLIRHGKLDEASDLCISAMRNDCVDKETYIFFILFIIRMKEQATGQPGIFDISDDPEVLINHYRALKFFIRRQEFPQMEPMQDELYSYCLETNTSMSALETIAEYSTLEPESIIEKIRKGFYSYERNKHGLPADTAENGLP